MLIRTDGKVFKRSGRAVAKGAPPVKTKKRKMHTPAPRPILKTDAWYEVEKVVAKKKSNLGILYLVKWAGYGKMHNSWIDELPPFFNKRHTMYQNKHIDYDSDESQSEESSQYSDDESIGFSVDESVEDSEEEEEWCNESSDESVSDDEVVTKKAKNNPKSSVDKHSLPDLYIESYTHKKKKTKEEKLVIKALLALSAVVAAGCVSGNDSDSDE